MGKAPLAGRVKTRLSPALPPRDAAALYECLLEDTAREMSRLRETDRLLVFDPPGAEAPFRSGAFAPFVRFAQRGRTLGERLNHAAGIAFARGARRVVIVGADCPALSAARVRQAFRELRDAARAVFGPAEDGGFYLVGLSAPAPRLFLGIPWSTASALSRVTGKCREAGMAFSLLPVESDVDTPEDLDALQGWVRAHARPPCPRTRRWIAAFFKAR